MPASNLITALHNALEPWPALGFFVELAVKSSLVLLAFLLLSLFTRHSSAARQHLSWTVCILSLGSLPVFLGLMPAWNLEWLLPLETTENMGNATEATGLITFWWPYVLKGYLVGLWLLLLSNVIALMRIVLLQWQATDCSNLQAVSMLDELLLDAMADVKVSLKEHKSLASPLSWGLLNPTIILPAANSEWSNDKLRHVLLHELQHIQRLDWVSLLAGRYACALYWYNPLVWLANGKMSRLAELACDDAVVLSTSKQAAYASDLVQLARKQQATTNFRHLAMAMAASFLGSRVVAILDGSRIRKYNDAVWVIRSILVAFTLVALLASTKVVQETGTQTTQFQGRHTIGIRFLQAEAEPGMPIPPVPTQPPTLVLSVNIPELETILVRPTGATGQPAGLVRPVSIQLEALPDLPVRQLPILLFKQFPEYPAPAAARGIEGFATIEYALDTAGRVSNPVVIEASPQQVFEQAALEAIRGYQYEPPRVNGTAVPVSGLRTRFVFQLDPDPE